MRTKRIVAISLLAACFAASGASAGGINLVWNDCGSGATNKSFRCDTNSGSHLLVASFDPDETIPALIGGSAAVDFQSASPTVPSWWQLAAGGCRDGALQLDLSASSQSCTATWPAPATGSLSYVNCGSPNRARIQVSWGVPEAQAAQVEPGTEYFAFRLALNNSRTIGSESCAGCEVPVCLVLPAIWLYQPAGMGHHALYAPLVNQFATWQGGAVGGVGCYGPFLLCPLPTAALNRTWGQIKTLYR
jgi:hypothetical protein